MATAVTDLTAILDAALRLPAPQRAELAERLLASLDGVDEERLPEGTEGAALLGPGWMEEIERRVEAYRRGEVTPVDGEQFFQQLLARRSS
jgi:putative addiction module component (TIGR02574 family)